MLRLLHQPLPKSASKLTSLYTLYLPCNTKPAARRPLPANASKTITAMRDDRVDVSISAPPRDGEANTAVRRVFAKVFNTAPSNVEVVRGEKSREKVLRIQDLVLDFGRRELSEEERIEEGLRIVKEKLREHCL